jgi:carbamoyl-phosphate synthase large subunit
VLTSPKGYFVLEMNPRFGGGYPFSHVAGANLPAALVAWVTGQPINPNWLTIKSDVLSSKCARLVTHKRKYAAGAAVNVEKSVASVN